MTAPVYFQAWARASSANRTASSRSTPRSSATTILLDATKEEIVAHHVEEATLRARALAEELIETAIALAEDRPTTRPAGFHARWDKNLTYIEDLFGADAVERLRVIGTTPPSPDKDYEYNDDVDGDEIDDEDDD